MLMKKIFMFVVMLMVMLIFVGCFMVFGLVDVYSVGQVQCEQIVCMGMVESVCVVCIQFDGGGSVIGMFGGGVFGVVVGSVIGGGKGLILMVIVGGFVGVVVGNVVGENFSIVNGVEIIVCFDNGDLCLIMQVVSGEVFCVGECVCLLLSGGVMCVMY